MDIRTMNCRAITKELRRRLPATASGWGSMEEVLLFGGYARRNTVLLDGLADAMPLKWRIVWNAVKRKELQITFEEDEGSVRLQVHGKTLHSVKEAA